MTPLAEYQPGDLEPQQRGYMAKELVLCTLPHSDPGDVPGWSRTNGKFTLGIQPGYDHKHKRSFVYPYGSIPRLLLFCPFLNA
jgi:hypothetical protein